MPDDAMIVPLTCRCGAKRVGVMDGTVVYACGTVATSEAGELVWSRTPKCEEIKS